MPDRKRLLPVAMAAMSLVIAGSAARAVTMLTPQGVTPFFDPPPADVRLKIDDGHGGEVDVTVGGGLTTTPGDHVSVGWQATASVPFKYDGPLSAGALSALDIGNPTLSAAIIATPSLPTDSYITATGGLGLSAAFDKWNSPSTKANAFLSVTPLGSRVVTLRFSYDYDINHNRFGATTAVRFNLWRSGEGWFFNRGFGRTASYDLPEPTTWALLLMGFAGVGATLRRRRRRNNFLASGPAEG